MAQFCWLLVFCEDEEGLGLTHRRGRRGDLGLVSLHPTDNHWTPCARLCSVLFNANGFCSPGLAHCNFLKGETSLFSVALPNEVLNLYVFVLYHLCHLLLAFHINKWDSRNGSHFPLYAPYSTRRNDIKLFYISIFRTAFFICSQKYFILNYGSNFESVSLCVVSLFSAK